MSIKFRLVQNQNRKNPKAYGKWYAKAVVNDTVRLKEIAAEIQENVSVKASDVWGVLLELTNVLKKNLSNGNRVIIDGFGSFKMGIRSTGTVTVKEYNASKNITDIHVNFMPEYTWSGADKRHSKPLLEGITVRETPKNTVLPEPDEDETTEPETTGEP